MVANLGLLHRVVNCDMHTPTRESQDVISTLEDPSDDARAGFGLGMVESGVGLKVRASMVANLGSGHMVVNLKHRSLNQ
jgi:hypothetical protein